MFPSFHDESIKCIFDLSTYVHLHITFLNIKMLNMHQKINCGSVSPLNITLPRSRGKNTLSHTTSCKSCKKVGTEENTECEAFNCSFHHKTK